MCTLVPEYVMFSPKETASPLVALQMAENASFPSLTQVKNMTKTGLKGKKGVTYNACTSVNWDKKWCYTKGGGWGNCNPTCQGN